MRVEITPMDTIAIPHRNRLTATVLLSGSGRTLENLLKKASLNELPLDVQHVISSRPAVRGLEVAANAGIAATTIRRKQFDSAEQFSDAIFGIARSVSSHVVLMAGFTQFAPVPTDFNFRVLNIHPSLIPAFSGVGFFGDHVHQAVLDYGAKITGCTIHFVDNQYDHGPVVLQRSVPVADDDTAETLSARVFLQECEAFPEALRRYASGFLRITGRRVWVDARLPAKERV